MVRDVVIAGAGPVGLMLAGELALGGVDVLVLEQRDEPDRLLKDGAMGARSLNAPSAAALHRRGLLDQVKAKAIWWFEPDSPPGAMPPFVGHFAGLPIASRFLDAEALANPFGAGVISQYALEVILAERVLRLGVEIRRGQAVTELTETADGVVVNGVEAQWLVGCDGGRSTVRKRAGIAFPGTDAEFTGRQAMVELEGDLPLGDWVRTSRGAYTHGPVPGRIHTVQYGPSPTRDTSVTAEEMQASLREVSGLDVTVTRVLAGTRYTDQTRQAESYRRGRVLLAGDAAHVHSPAGGQGLNLGLGDAANLGWKLAATVRGWAPAGLLDTYTAERHPVGAWVQGWSDAQSALGRPDPRTSALRAVVADLLASTAGATYVLRHLGGLDFLPPQVKGAPTPQDGRAILVGVPAGSRLAAVARGWADRLAVVEGETPVPATFVRPDGVVAWTGTDPDEAATAIGTWLGAVLTVDH